MKGHSSLDFVSFYLPTYLLWYCRIFKSTYFEEQLQTAAFVVSAVTLSRKTTLGLEILLMYLIYFSLFNVDTFSSNTSLIKIDSKLQYFITW